MIGRYEFFGGITTILIFNKNLFDDEMECSRYMCIFFCMCVSVYPCALYTYWTSLAIKFLKNTRLFQKGAACSTPFLQILLKIQTSVYLNKFREIC